ncbi:hypothetical protein VSDG_09550 [Cytospora chrysosperma]|uniref:Uncharacterized protein n=1 Tax=Cytospora chrysosperma TaxID=252740 RepID=A0A423VAH2_CYTCH|nr:hypothetical protein VSDG_09550 [Valsa sordida]
MSSITNQATKNLEQGAPADAGLPNTEFSSGNHEPGSKLTEEHQSITQEAESTPVARTTETANSKFGHAGRMS